MPFLILFVVIPFIELAIFAAVSDHIGLITALLFALLTAMIGGNVVRMQGLQTFSSMRGSMDKGNIPTTEIFDGFCLVAAGALLITPGFLTDAIGFVLLVPRFRDFLRVTLKKHTNFNVHTAGFGQATPHDPTIIEGEYEADNGDTQENENDTKRLS
ncbi:MAG: FxsA family protein [Bdellovibrionales bacterium]